MNSNKKLLQILSKAMFILFGPYLQFHIMLLSYYDNKQRMEANKKVKKPAQKQQPLLCQIWMEYQVPTAAHAQSEMSFSCSK
jgi:hypothetical protein